MIRRPAAILALLTALNLLNYLDRFVLSAVLPLVQDSLHLSNFIAGALATVFLIGYFATSPIFGQLADRTDVFGGRGARKEIMALGVGVWSAATFATGLAAGSPSLVAARAVVGVGEASYATVAPTMIDDMAPPDRKGRWLSIFYLAIPIGSALGFVIGGIVGKHFGWRSAFFAVGVPGMLVAALCLLIAEPVKRVAREKVAIVESTKKLFVIPLYRRGVLGYCAQTFAMGGFGYWAPTFLYRRYDLPLDEASGTFGVVLVVAGGLGTWFGGWWADRWIARADASQDDDRSARIALRVCAVSSALAAPLALGCFLSPTPTMFFTMAFFCELALFISMSPINTVLLRTVPKELRASAMALSIFSIHLLGDLWSPPLLGVAQDYLPLPTAMSLVPFAIAVSAAAWWTQVLSPSSWRGTASPRS